MRVEIWSDLICPWCYLAKRRLEQAIDRVGRRDEMDVVWRSYRLNPELPATPSVDMADYMARRYHLDRPRAELGLQRLTQLAAADGLAYRLDLMHPTDTLDGHRLLHLALDHGVQDAVKEALFRAVLTEGRAIADWQVLTETAVGAGLPAADVADVLGSDRYRTAVEDDEAAGRRHHLESVPFLVFDGRDRVAAARSVDELERTLRRVLR